jgi:16S rRNA (uracil1498-N3)-methyltransferase
MTRRRWIADEVEGNRAALTGTNAAHLARVLRASIGQEFDIATGQEIRLGRVVNVSNDRVDFELGAVVETGRTVHPIKVALAVFKFDRFEWAVEKCTELGVAMIVPIIAHRTDSHLAAAAPKRVERWQRIAREASQQSRREASPEIAEPLRLKQYLAEEHSSRRILLAESEQQVFLRDLISSSADTALAIGPEGGWTNEEVTLFVDSGWKSASLGNTILRAETAAVAAVAILASTY